MYMSGGLLGDVLGTSSSGGIFGQILGMPMQILGLGAGAAGGGLMQMIMPMIMLFVGVELFFKLMDKM